MMEGDTRLIIEDLFVGRVISVTAREAKVRLDDAHEAYGIHYNGFTYGAGEVGELLVFEGRSNLVIGQIKSVYEESCESPCEIRRVCKIILLSTACVNTGKLKTGVSNFPRLTARVFCVPIEYLRKLHIHAEDENVKYLHDKVYLQNLDRTDDTNGDNKFQYAHLGTLQNFRNISFQISLTKLLNRHCGIFGATGAGKTFTAVKLIEEIIKNGNSKVILLDPTGEYEAILNHYSQNAIKRVVLGSKFNANNPNSLEKSAAYFPIKILSRAALNTLFQPNEAQKPYLDNAIISLRDETVDKSSVGEISFLEKIDKKASDFLYIGLGRQKNEIHFPSLPIQLMEECVIEKNGVYREDVQAQINCKSLSLKIKNITSTNDFKNLFLSSGSLDNDANFLSVIDRFLTCEKVNVLHVCLKEISIQNRLKEFALHIIGNYLFEKKSNYGAVVSGRRLKPTLLLLDEAHNFLSVDSREISKDFNAFERIAREGRKIGLNLCLITQCPKDLPEVVLNQLGTIIVHRLSGDHDRKLIERSCGDIDVSALSSLPILGTGQAVVLGTNFPIPVVVNVDKPENPPKLH